MSLENDIQLLRQIEILDDFNADQLRLVAFGSQRLNYPENYELFRQDQITDGGYVIISGAIELLEYVNGEDQTRGVYGPGSILGELALISRNKRSVTAMVRQPCEVLKITRSTMHRIMDEYPELAVALQARVSANIVELSNSLIGVHEKLDRVRFKRET
ncbi:MAG: cyclic nucleotide-binding domain-containing protein [Pseudomonadota bacterium]